MRAAGCEPALAVDHVVIGEPDDDGRRIHKVDEARVRGTEVDLAATWKRFDALAPKPGSLSQRA